MPSTKVNPNTPKTDRANAAFNAKRGRPRGLPLLQFKRTARCRPPVSGALASHGLTPQYSRRDGA